MSFWDIYQAIDDILRHLLDSRCQYRSSFKQYFCYQGIYQTVDGLLRKSYFGQRESRFLFGAPTSEQMHFPHIQETVDDPAGHLPDIYSPCRIYKMLQISFWDTYQAVDGLLRHLLDSRCQYRSSFKVQLCYLGIYQRPQMHFW